MHPFVIGDLITIATHIPPEPTRVIGLYTYPDHEPGVHRQGVWLEGHTDPIPVERCTMVAQAPQLPRDTYAGQAEHLTRLLALGAQDRETNRKRGWEVPFWPSRPEKTLAEVHP